MKGKTFNEVAKTYIQYVDRHFGPHSHTVFDWYKKVDLKSAQYYRRYQNQALDVIINGDANISFARALLGEFE